MLILLTFSLMLIINVKLFSQENKIDIGFSKLNNNWLFQSNSFYKTESNAGIFTFGNNYQGTAIEEINNSFRDDALFFANYDYPINQNFFVTVESKYYQLSDKREKSLNELIRISGIGGVSGKIDSLFNYKILLGAEDNKRVTVQSVGFLSKAEATLNNLNIDDYKINSMFRSELLFLKDSRQSKDIEALVETSKLFSTNNLLSFGIKYKLQGRDFIQTSRVENVVPIESNLDNRISGFVVGNLELWKNSILNFEGTFENISINRYFKQSYENINHSNVNKFYDELNLNSKINIDFIFNSFFQKIGFMLAHRVEENYLRKRYEIDNAVFSQMQNIESQKDNYSTTTTLFAKTIWNISKFDTLKADLSFSKLEYDTPSKLNNDDRDELNSIISIAYLNKLSKILDFLVNLNYYQRHLVFIKKESSAQNLQNRVLSLSSGVRINTDVFAYNPNFEVLANYTVYDYETSGKVPRSYSFRQIAYTDSLRIYFTQKLFFTNRFSIRYFEQGKLFWDSFSEIPQQNNLEISIFPMLNDVFNEKLTVGFGNRFFLLKYGNIATNVTNNSTKIFTFAPEAYLKYRFNKIIVYCYGWLEHRYMQNNFVSRTPNLFLQTLYYF